MSLYAILLDPECDLEDFLGDLTHVVWGALVMVNQVGDPHHYPFLEGHLREFIKPYLMLCDCQGCWKPYVHRFERRSASLGLRPVVRDGLAAYLNISGTREEFTKALVEWLWSRIRPILYDQNDMDRALRIVRGALLKALEGSTQEIATSSQAVSGRQ